MPVTLVPEASLLDVLVTTQTSGATRTPGRENVVRPETGSGRTRVLPLIRPSGIADRPALESRLENWREVRESAGDAANIVAGARRDLKTVDDALTTMRRALGTLDDQRFSRGLARDRFHDALKAINKVIDGRGDPYNLTDRIDKVTNRPNALIYTSDPEGGRTTLQGVYAGTGFRIDTERGTTWVADYGDMTLKEYRRPGDDGFTAEAATGREVPLPEMTGMTLTGIGDPGGQSVAVTFTYDPTPGSEEAYSGVLVKQGLGVLPDAFYGGFVNDDGTVDPDAVDRAEEALDTARERLRGMEAHMDANLETAAAHRAVAERAVEALEGQLTPAEDQQTVLQTAQEVERATPADAAAAEESILRVLAGATGAGRHLLDVSA